MVEELDTPVVDFASHFHTDDLEEVDEQSDLSDDVDTDPGKYLQWFKKGGIDKVVLSDTAKPKEEVETVRGSNNELLDIVTSYEDYYGLGAIPMGTGGEEAAAELERCLDEGLNGGFTYVEAGDQDFTDPTFQPVWEVADRTGAPILVHIISRADEDQVVLEQENQINHMFGREARLCGSIAKVINQGVLDRYPDLNLVYHHYGGNIASMMGRVDLRHTRSDATNVSFDEFKEQLADRIYIDTSGQYAYNTPLRTALEHFPASNILLGTDSSSETKTPAELRANVTNFYEAAPPEDVRKMAGQNALDLMVNV